MRTIAVLNQKGGVGKTTTVANTAAALATKGKRVVVVDLDPQGHLTIHYGINSDEQGSGAYEVLVNSADMKESLIKVRENLWLLGANIDLVGAESELVSVVGRETIFREALEPIKNDYDFMLIDCPPSLGLLSLNALAAVDEVLIPVQPHFLALQGFGQLLQTVSLVSKRINPSLTISAILLCMFDTRVTLSSEVKADIEQFLESARQTDCPWSNAEIVPVHIRRNIKLAEAPSYGKTIFEYEPGCNGSIDYQKVADFICGDIKKELDVEDIVEEVDVDEVEDAADTDVENSDDTAVTNNDDTAPVSTQPAESEPLDVPDEPAIDDTRDIEATA